MKATILDSNTFLLGVGVKGEGREWYAFLSKYYKFNKRDTYFFNQDTNYFFIFVTILSFKGSQMLPLSTEAHISFSFCVLFRVSDFNEKMIKISFCCKSRVFHNLTSLNASSHTFCIFDVFVPVAVIPRNTNFKNIIIT